MQDAQGPVVVWNCVGAELGGGEGQGSRHQEGLRREAGAHGEETGGVVEHGWEWFVSQVFKALKGRREIGQTLLPSYGWSSFYPGLIMPLLF